MFVIVKHASDTTWKKYYKTDPKLGADVTMSVHGSFSGDLFNVKPIYPTIQDALEDLEKLNECNPQGAYGICPLKIKGS